MSRRQFSMFSLFLVLFALLIAPPYMGVSAQIEPESPIFVPSYSQTPPLAFTFSGPTDPVAVGQAITLTGRLDNLSPFPLNSVQVDVPPHTAVYYTSGPSVPAEGMVGGTLDLGDLPSAQTIPLTLRAHVVAEPINGLIELPFQLRTAATEPITATVTLSVTQPVTLSVTQPVTLSVTQPVTQSLLTNSADDSGTATASEASLSLTSEPNRWQMAYTPPAAAAFSGAATTSYPIAVPPGIGGLMPSLALSYNSRGFENLDAPYAASGFGVGWGMPQPQISNGNAPKMFDTDPDNWNQCDAFQNNRFTLSLNGASYQLQARQGVSRHGRYEALGDPSLYIEYLATSSSNVTGEYWLLKTPDGTAYIFGQSEQAEQAIGPLKEGCSQSYQNGSQPRNQNFMALSWKLESITNVYGRQLKYSYGTACSRGTGDACRRFPITTFVPESYTFGSPAPNQSGNQFRREADVALYRIEYNFVGTAPQTVIQFDYSAQNWDTLRDYRWMATGHYRPERAIVTHAGQTIAGYIFTYGQLNHYSSWDNRSTTFWWLTSIKPYGRDYVYGSPPTGTALPTTTFSYEQNTAACGPDVGGTTRCLPILTKIDNGYGAVSRFIYERYNGTGGLDASGEWFVVKEFYTWDGVHHPYSANNNTAASRLLASRSGYSACYDKDGSGCRSLAAEPSHTLVGFSGVTLSTQEYSGSSWTTLSKSQEEFNIAAYWLNGKTTVQRSLHPANNSELSRETFSWVLAGSYGTNAQLSRQDHYLFADGNTLLSFETFSYLNGANDFGALFERKEYRRELNGSDTLYRCTQHAYAHQTTGSVWLVNRPLRYTLYNGSCGGTKLAETLYRYDAPTSTTDIDLNGKAALEYTLTWRGNNTADTNYVTTRQTYYGAGANVGLPYQTISYSNYSGNGVFASAVSNTSTVTGYNVLGLPTGSQTSASGLTTQSQSATYDANFPWLPASSSDANNAITSYEYDKFGRLTKLIRPGDTSANPTMTTNYWDNSGNSGGIFLQPMLIQTAYKGSNGVRQFYNGLGQLVQEQAPRSDTRFGSTGFGERDVLTSYRYDARGLLTCQTMPYDIAPFVWTGLTPYRNDNCNSFAGSRSSYDSLGRLVKSTAPDGTITGYHHYGVTTMNGVAETYHDVIDANRHRTQQNYDAWGRLTKVYEISGDCESYWASEGFGCAAPYTSPWRVYTTTSYSYNARDQLVDVWDNANINNSRMTYNALGQKLSMNDPDMGSWTYEYYVSGTLSRQVDANGKRLCFFYDNFNRLTSKQRDAANNSCASGAVQLAAYTYETAAATNDIGRLTKVVDTSGEHTFSYDNRGRLSSESRLITGNATNFSMSYAYDALDRLTSQTYPNGEVVSTSYNNQGLPDYLSGSNTYVNAAQYNRMGQLKILDLGNGLKTYYGYNGYEAFAQDDDYDAQNVTWNWVPRYGQLWRICTAPDASTRCLAVNKDLAVSDQRMDIRHSFDGAGNVAAVRDYLNSNQVQWFSYDHRNRLETAYTDAVGQGQYSHTGESNDYDYNEIGNILRLGNGNSYNYSSWNAGCAAPLPTQSMPHAVRQIAGTANYFCYDKNGNMIKRVEGGLTYTQNFDVENRLTSVIVSGQTTSFVYDADGQRMKVSEPGGVTTYYPFPGYEHEVNGSTNTRRITYSLAGQAIALRKQIVGGSNTLYFLHSDHLGSTSLMTTSTGSTVAGSSARYYPFGDWRTEPTANLSDRGFTGHLHNNLGNSPNDIGLIFMNARYYSPGLGKFISADTLVPAQNDPQALNRYAYARNNPLLIVDPSGHCWGFASGLRNTFYATTCNNLDMAVTIVNSPDASVGQKIVAGGYVAVEAVAHGTVAVGTAIVGGHVAAAAVPYVGAAVSVAESAAIAHPTASAVVGGVTETAVECSMTGGGCNYWDYIAGGATAGVAHRLSTPHGNSSNSTRPQHGYEIYEIESRDVLKTGISGQTLNSNGTSPRANQQVNALNRNAGETQYGARVVITNLSDRASALNWERGNAQFLWDNGNSMDLHKRPRPWEQ